jgi:hypothetical protein
VRKSRTAIHLIAVFVLALFTLGPNPAWSQAASGTISGTVTDPTKAVIPNASVVLENLATGVKITTVSNGTGFFNFAAVAPGTYKLQISAAGFTSWSQTGLIEHQGESHTIPNIALPIAGATTEVVTVTASDAAVIPLDNGASSTTLNSEMVDKLSVQGRNSAELVKFMPGMAMNSGLTQSEYSSQITQTNSGPIGQFSASGTQPYGSMQMTLDGAGLIDIGNMGTQLASINADQTAEFTYLNAAFGADTPRGPNIIQVVSKGGTAKYHGDVYTYLRNWQFNANDPYLKSQVPNAQRTIAHQTYPGGTVGGPVPSIFGYNKNHDKLFFFAGFETMFQNPSATLHQLVIPTENMINGDFSADTLPGMQSSSSQWWNSSQVPCANAASWTGFCPAGGSNQNMFVNGQIPKQYWEPNGVALLTWLNKTHTPNIDPATHNGYNYQYMDNAPVNRWELRARGDWNPTDNDRVTLVYTKQNEANINRFGVWWWPSWTAPLASPLNATTISNLWTANYVHTFNASTTNEFSFAKTYFTYPPRFTNPDAMSASAAGYTTYAPFDALKSQTFDQLPNLISWGAGTGAYNGSFAGVYAPAMMKDFGGSFGNVKKIMSFQDNLTKVLGRHSLKAGFFWDVNDQTQTTSYGSWTQGALNFDQWTYYTTNNVYADMLIGNTSIQQFAGAPTHDVAFHEWAGYVQDKWQAARKLTLNYGIRLDHEGQWYPVHGPGFAVFNPKLYDDSATASAWTGMTWHQKDHSIPQSGLKSTIVTPDVRVGAAYDLYGNGRTVLRGGFGIYRWQTSEGDVDAALAPAYNIQNISTPAVASSYWWKQQGMGGPGGYAQLATYAPGNGAWGACQSNATCSNASVMKMGETKNPYTNNWDVMLDQQLPQKMMFELQYIGNHTANVPLTNNSTANEASFSNANKIPMGALFGVNRLTGKNVYQENCDAGNCAVPQSSDYAGFRPYANYGILNLIQRGSYSNYNGMIVALQKQTGPVTFLVNYTWSKVLGIRDGNTENGGGDGPTIDPFNMRANYGNLAYDRRHLFNAAFNANLPGLHDANSIVRAVTNGWTLSGDTQVQSGSPLQPNTNGTLNVQWTGVGNANLLGSNAPILSPYLTCDPRNGGGKYFNDKCFKTPDTKGVNGPSVWPNITGPAFFVSDLAMYKAFKITESQNIQFRVSAFNFLNHPLPQFGQGQDVNLHMDNVSGQNTNATTNGNVQYKAPNQNRFMELALKYYF